MATSNNTHLLPISQGPRVIVYHQTHHKPNNGPPVSLLPLIGNNTGVTHVIVAAVHLNDPPGNITLNDTPPDADKFHTLWSETSWLQRSGVKVLAMLGGAAKGTYARLDGDDERRFESYYIPLRDMLRRHRFDGVDLDIEEEMSLTGVVRLIDRLRSDFGPDFLITMAPVATALLPNVPHLSGFDYKLLSQMRDDQISWYNTQFYCGWGDAGSTYWYDAIMSLGWWPASKVVMGLITNPCLGAGHVAWPQMRGVLQALRAKHPGFGGVMGWEYFCALPGDQDRPWEWVKNMAQTIRTPPTPTPAPASGVGGQVPIRPYGGQLSPAPQPFPAEKVSTLQELGFNQQQVVAALNMTSGNVEQAAVLLLDS